MFKKNTYLPLILMLLLGVMVSACVEMTPAVEESAPAAEAEAEMMADDPTACNVAAPAEATEINMIGWFLPDYGFLCG